MQPLGSTLYLDSSILRPSGYNFRLTFQVLHEIFCNDENKATALLDPFELASKASKSSCTKPHYKSYLPRWCAADY